MEDFNENRMDPYDINYFNILQNFRIRQKELGFTNGRMAALLGITYSNYNRLINGKYTMTLIMAIKIAHTLNLALNTYDRCITINDLRDLCEEEEVSAAAAAAGNAVS